MAESTEMQYPFGHPTPPGDVIFLDHGELERARSHPEMIVEYNSLKFACNYEEYKIKRLQFYEKYGRHFRVFLFTQTLSRLCGADKARERFPVTTTADKRRSMIMYPSSEAISLVSPQIAQRAVATYGMRVPSIWDLPKSPPAIWFREAPNPDDISVVEMKNGAVVRCIEAKSSMRMASSMISHLDSPTFASSSSYGGASPQVINSTAIYAMAPTATSPAHDDDQVSSPPIPHTYEREADQVHIPSNPDTYEAEASTQRQFLPAQAGGAILDMAPAARSHQGASFPTDDQVHIQIHDETFETEIGAQFQVAPTRPSPRLEGRRGISRMNEAFLTITSPALLAFVAMRYGGTTNLSSNAIIVLHTAEASIGLAFLLGILCSHNPTGVVARTMSEINRAGTAFGYAALMTMLLPDEYKLWVTAVSFCAFCTMLVFAIRN